MEFDPVIPGKATHQCTNTAVTVMDSEEETLDDLQFEGSSDEAEIDEDILGALEDTLNAEASDAAAEVC